MPSEVRAALANMDGLLPIVRRVRRPLVPVAGAAGGADAKPAVAPAPKEQKAVVTKGEPTTASDAKAASHQGKR